MELTEGVTKDLMEEATFLPTPRVDKSRPGVEGGAECSREREASHPVLKAALCRSVGARVWHGNRRPGNL